MRIGVYDPYLDDLGGGEKYMMVLATTLAKNHTVDIFWDEKKDFELLSERFNIDFSNTTKVKNIFTKKVSFWKRFFTTQKYDAVIILSDGSIPLLGCKKLFLHIQQPLHQTQNNTLWGKFKLSRVYKIFCNSEYTKRFVDKMLSEKTEVIYPPVLIQAKNIKKENIILHVGRFRVKNVEIDDYKKQGVMLEAFKDMVDKGLKNWKFVLAVSYMEKDKEAFDQLKKKARGYPIEFLVNRTNEQLWEMYSRAKIYWHASGYEEDLTAHPEFAEHFGISTVEAMGAGAVPVVINAGGQKEIVTSGENGFLWETLTDLQEKTVTLTKDKNLMKKLSRNAKKKAKKYSFENFERSIGKLIR